MKEILIHIMCLLVIGAPLWALYDFFKNSKPSYNHDDSHNETNSAYYLYDAQNDRW